MRELDQIQKTLDELRVSLGAGQARKYTSANGAVELNLDSGEIKLAGIALGSLPSEPQMITVTVGEWSESDLPRNAIKRYKFIGDQVIKIPVEHRDSAEFSTEDISFARDGSDIRTALTYQRREATEEAAERFARQSGSGIVISNKTNGDITVISNGKVVARFGCLKEELPDNPVTLPFAVEGSLVFVPDSAVAQACWRTAVTDQGKCFAAGIGLGTEAQSVDELLNALAANIEPLKFEITEPADRIRQVIRDELKPGGMLHRG